MGNNSWRWRMFWASGLLSIIVGCGGGSGGGLSGAITQATFRLAAGETRSVTGDLTIRCTDEIVIDGSMNVDPKAKLFLISDKSVQISGKIQTTPTRGRQTTENNLTVYGANNVQISGQVAGLGNVFVWSSTGDVVVSGSIVGANGANGASPTDPGKPGGSIDIGTERALDAIKQIPGLVPKPPVNFTFAGTIKGGDGGAGFNDESGRFVGKDLVVMGSDGGKGGEVTVVVSDRFITSTSSPPTEANFNGGRGGIGGDAGTEGKAVAKDGLTAGERGGNVTATAGDGGATGIARVIEDSLRLIVIRNEDADPGDVTIVVGRGGPGGKGGSATVTLGYRGIGDSISSSLQASKLAVSGGQEGNSDDPNRAGGNGGDLILSKKLTAVDPVPGPGSSVKAFGRGGNGFNGCLVNPKAPGTGGGNGGTIGGSAVFAANLFDECLNGGAGGDGSPNPGAGGAGGAAYERKLGVDGSAGGPCSFAATTATGVGFLCVQLDFPLGPDLAAGDIVPLSRFKGGRPSPTELPVTATQGCNSDHFHSSGTITVEVLKNDRWVTLGPFEDPNHDRCGFGKLLVQPSPTVTAKSGVR